jgi:hypothetical protein
LVTCSAVSSDRAGSLLNRVAAALALLPRQLVPAAGAARSCGHGLTP